MNVLLAAALAALNLVWLLLVLAGLPGNWLMVLTTLGLAWWKWQAGVPASGQMFHPATLITIVALALLGELLEFLAGLAGARRSGAGWLSSVCAIAGAVVGAGAGTLLIPVPLLGTLLGACGGAFAAVAIVELYRGRPMHASLRRGLGAGVGEFFGILSKMAMGVAIYVVIAVAAFWP